MHKRPLSVIIISCLLIGSGLAGLAFHAADFYARPLPSETFWVALVRFAAVVAGAFMLRGDNWARWLAMMWIAAHVVLSVFHSIPQLLIHVLVLVLFAIFLFRAPATEYFRAKQRGTA